MFGLIHEWVQDKIFVAQISKSAVSPISNWLGAGFSTLAGFGRRSADWKSAIQQDAILRYDRRILSSALHECKVRMNLAGYLNCKYTRQPSLRTPSAAPALRNKREASTLPVCKM